MHVYVVVKVDRTGAVILQKTFRERIAAEDHADALLTTMLSRYGSYQGTVRVIEQFVH